MKTGIDIITEELKQLEASDDLSYRKRREDEKRAVIAGLYAMPKELLSQTILGKSLISFLWPSNWPDWWIPKNDNRISSLAKAGALIAAEIDRLQSEVKTKMQNQTVTAQEAMSNLEQLFPEYQHNVEGSRLVTIDCDTYIATTKLTEEFSLSRKQFTCFKSRVRKYFTETDAELK